MILLTEHATDLSELYKHLHTLHQFCKLLEGLVEWQLTDVELKPFDTRSSVAQNVVI